MFLFIFLFKFFNYLFQIIFFSLFTNYHKLYSDYVHIDHDIWTQKNIKNDIDYPLWGTGAGEILKCNQTQCRLATSEKTKGLEVHKLYLQV